MKALKEIFWNPMSIFIYISVVGLFLCALFYTKPKRYVGTVTEVSSWSGDATLKTKTESGKDTTLHVCKHKFEQFVVGQVITVWTGGELIGDIASTHPQ